MSLISAKNREKFKSIGENIAMDTLDRISMGITQQLNIDTNPGDFFAANISIDHILQACIDKLLAEQRILRNTKGYVRTMEVISKMEDRDASQEAEG